MDNLKTLTDEELIIKLKECNKMSENIRHEQRKRTANYREKNVGKYFKKVTDNSIEVIKVISANYDAFRGNGYSCKSILIDDWAENGRVVDFSIEYYSSLETWEVATKEEYDEVVEDAIKIIKEDYLDEVK